MIFQQMMSVREYEQKQEFTPYGRMRMLYAGLTDVKMIRAWASYSPTWKAECVKAAVCVSHRL